MPFSTDNGCALPLEGGRPQFKGFLKRDPGSGGFSLCNHEWTRMGTPPVQIGSRFRDSV